MDFFSTLNSIVNVFGSSSKHHYELKSIREAEIIDLIASGELKLVHELIKFIHYNNMEQLVGALILLRSVG